MAALGDKHPSFRKYVERMPNDTPSKYSVQGHSQLNSGIDFAPEPLSSRSITKCVDSVGGIRRLYAACPILSVQTCASICLNLPLGVYFDRIRIVTLCNRRCLCNVVCGLTLNIAS